MTELLAIDDVVTLNDTGTPITTSLTIAKGIDYGHKAVIQLVRQNQRELEEFGLLTFKIQPRPEGQHGGGDVTYAVLTEPQATLLITMMRNTDIVKRFKITLIKAFYELRERLASTPAPLSTGDMFLQYAQAYKAQEVRINRLEASQQHIEETQNHIAEVMNTRFTKVEKDIEDARIVPPKTMRAQINEIVRASAPYGSKPHYQAAWQKLYREFRLRYRIDLTVRAKKDEISRLDWAERYGHLFNLWCLAKELFDN